MHRTIGQNLRAARESAGLTLLDVAHCTRIPANRLQQLEDGNVAAFGSMAYARSFLKSYSRFLNVDASEALEELPAPVLGGPSDYRYLTDTQGPWIEKRERPQRRREPLARSARSPLPTLAFMFAIFVVAGALLASHLVEMKKTDHKSPATKSAETSKPAENAVAKEPQHITVGAQVPSNKEAASPPGASPSPDQNTVIRPAVVPTSIPAPDSPTTPVRRPQIVD